MVINSEKYKNILFVHIPKTGGQSIRSALGWGNMESVCVHLTALGWIDSMGWEHWNSSYTFSVVRNPWDRMVSAYFYDKKRHWSGPLETVAGRISPSQTQKGTYVERFNSQRKKNHHPFNDLSFEGYLDWRMRECPPWPCMDFLVDQRGKMLVKDIIKLENFQKDFNKVCTEIGINPIKLPHKNKTRHEHYSTYYNDRTKDLVYKVFKKDVKYFKYEFEN